MILQNWYHLFCFRFRHENLLLKKFFHFSNIHWNWTNELEWIADEVSTFLQILHSTLSKSSFVIHRRIYAVEYECLHHSMTEHYLRYIRIALNYIKISLTDTQQDLLDNDDFLPNGWINRSSTLSSQAFFAFKM